MIWWKKSGHTPISRVFKPMTHPAARCWVSCAHVRSLRSTQPTLGRTGKKAAQALGVVMSVNMLTGFAAAIYAVIIAAASRVVDRALPGG